MVLSEASVNAENNKSETVFDAQHWALTLGILLGVTLTAFEALAIVTIAPTISNALEGTQLYGWIFSGFMLAALLGTVLGGQQADVHGPGRPFAGGLISFGAGLLIAGFAPNMLLLIIGRVVQGLGSGAMITALYATVNVAYSDALRPRLVALMSSAWVVPALVGPAIAGFIAERLGWRIVFWGLVPLLVLVLLLAMPSFRKHAISGQGKTQAKKRESPVLAALGLVLGTGLLLSGLGAENRLLAGAMVLGGAALATVTLRPLTPKGTLRFAAGLPSIIATRGLLYASFAGVQAFVALMLADVHGFSTSVAGVAIASGALSWTAGSWLQDRLDSRQGPQNRHLRILAGSTILAAGLAVQVAALFTSVGPLVLSILGWVVGGLGIGLAFSSCSVLAFALAPEGQEGKVASSLQLADQFTAAVSTGVGGALFAYALSAGGSQQTGIFYAYLLCLLFAGLSVWAAYRIGWTSVKTLDTIKVRN